MACHFNPAGSRQAQIIFVCAALLSLAACGGAAQSDSSGIPSVLAAQMPALPFDNPGERGASVAEETTILGSNFHLKSTGSFIVGSGLELPSDPGGIEWGIYEYVAGDNTLLSLRTSYTTAAGSSVWIALANYARQAWDFAGPYVSESEVPLSDEHVSPGGNFYFAVVSYDGTDILVNSSTVTADVVPSTVLVEMQLSSFNQQTVNVDPGTEIVWSNVSALPHTVTIDALNAFPGGPNSDIDFPTGIAPAGTYSFTVPAGTASGTAWYYHCRFHGFAGNGSSLGTGMTGVVMVN